MEYFYSTTKQFTRQFTDIITSKKTEILMDIMSELAEGLIERENIELGITRK